jgi:hypothetical protein
MRTFPQVKPTIETLGRLESQKRHPALNSFQKGLRAYEFQKSFIAGVLKRHFARPSVPNINFTRGTAKKAHPSQTIMLGRM